MKKILPFLGLALSACSTITTSSMLAQFNGVTPLSLGQLRSECDLQDAAACYFAGRPAPALVPALERVPIVQGPAGPQRAIFTALLSQTQHPQWFLYQNKERSLKKLIVAQTTSKPHSPWRLEQLELFGLEANQNYSLLAADKAGHLLDVRTFQTMKSDARANLRFALIAGTDDAGFGPAVDSPWKELLTLQPQVLFALGNNAYATLGAQPSSLEYLWDRNVETRRATALFRAPNLMPIAATWDDRDYGTFEGNSSNPLVDQARELQLDFFPLLADNETVKNGPGVSKAILVGGQTFILMDDRSFREADARPPACEKNTGACRGRKFVRETDNAHFGRLQADWATDLVAKAQGPVWLLSGDSWFNGGLNPSVAEGNHPKEFASFRQDLLASVQQAAHEQHHFPVFFAGAAPEAAVHHVQPFGGYQTFEYAIGPATLAGGQAGSVRYFESSVDPGFRFRTELLRDGKAGKPEEVSVKDAHP